VEIAGHRRVGRLCSPDLHEPLHSHNLNPINRMKIYILSAALAFAPITARAQSTNDPPPGAALFQLVVATVIVGVAATAIYTVFKTAHAAADKKCAYCNKAIGKNSWCPACGKAYSCKECGAVLQKDATKCGRCFTDVPPPRPILRSVQLSDGTNWTTAATSSLPLDDDLSIMRFATQEEFEAWAAQTNIISIIPIGNSSNGWFRLASE